MRKFILKYLGYDKLQKELIDLKKRCKYLESFLDVSVDIHQKEPSWAVVCLRGKIERVNFYISDSNTIEEIAQFLRQFKKENIIIDAHPQCAYLMKDMLK
jgi:hypothetical protein